MLGERDAFDLGVEVGRVRIVVFLVASLLVGSSVAASGSVGYVGLVVPHLARLSLGSDNRISIPAAALGGALFVIVADTVARTIIAPRELPVGAITAFIGAPLFIYLIEEEPESCLKRVTSPSTTIIASRWLIVTLSLKRR